MKKRIILLIIAVLLTTGCTCEYNLTIDNNTYHEKIILTGTTSEEITNFSNKWQIPVDKEEYNSIGGDTNSGVDVTGDIYEYSKTGNNLVFNYDFTTSGINNSTAISQCYSKATITAYQDSIIISTSDKVNCFDRYAPLTNLKINITTTKSVKSHNADSVNGNTYTWNVNSTNANNKPINLLIDNSNTSSSSTSSSSGSNSNIKDNTKEKDYTFYIFCVIILLVMLLGYFIFTKIKKDRDDL